VSESETKNLSETLRQWENGRRRRGPDCLSDRALDGVLAGEIRDAPLASARTHLAGCSACASAFQALTDDRQRFLADANPAALAADALARAAAMPVHSWWRRLAPAFTVTAAAAVTIILAVPQLHDNIDRSEQLRSDDLRAKGAVEAPPALGLAMYVKHTEQADSPQVEPHWGELLHPGDQIRLTVDNDRAGKVTVLAVDAAGQISVYQPAIHVAVGRAQRLPQAIELDETLGDEVIVAVRCPDSIATQAVVAAAERALNRAMVKQDPVGALGTLSVPCAEVRYAIQKVALP
jgi:hypothetical protein